MGRLLAVSDVHGYYQLFEKLMRLVQYNPASDVLVICGDLIDRGPESAKMIEWCLPGNEGQHAIVLKGNHELELLRFLSGERCFSNYGNSFMGGIKTLKSYLPLSDLDLMKHLDYIGRLGCYYRQDGFLFVHGGLSNYKRVEYQTEDELTYEYSKYYLTPGSTKHREIVVFGHTPTNIIRQHLKEPIPEKSYVWYDLKHRNKIGIDCGNSEHKRLCCLDLTNSLEYYVGFYAKDEEIRPCSLGLNG